MLRELKGPQIEDVPHADVIGPVGVLRGRTRRRPRDLANWRTGELAQRHRVGLVRGVAGDAVAADMRTLPDMLTSLMAKSTAVRPWSRARWCAPGAHRAGTAGKEAVLYRIRMAERTGRLGKR